MWYTIPHTYSVTHTRPPTPSSPCAGALNPKRLAAFKERSRSLAQDPDMPPFLYGSHYSSAAAVVFFLLRLEPFTRHAWDLQDGRFDHADRLFHSVAEAWRNCQESTSDVKELTPEFYYLPDFLVNGNAYPLGARQDGTELGDVCLPPWARGSPDAFVRRMREALESEHVSLRLHDWVDLVFGQKQRGSLAEAADNTFFHTTYEGSVDLGAVADPGLRQALADQVRHFGQTPSQLFDARRPHPARRLPRPVVGLGATGVFVPADVRAGLALEAAAKGAGSQSPATIAAIAIARDGTVVTVRADGVVQRFRWAAGRHEGGSFGLASGAARADGARLEEMLPRPETLPVFVKRLSNERDCSGAHSIDQQLAPPVILSPSSGGSISALHVSGAGRMLRCVGLAGKRAAGAVAMTYHTSRISCVAADDVLEDGPVAAGGADGAVLVWAGTAHGRGPGAQPASEALVHPPRPYLILPGHGSAVTCLAISASLGLVISGSTVDEATQEQALVASGSPDNATQAPSAPVERLQSTLFLSHALQDGRRLQTLRLPRGSGPAALTAIAGECGLLLAHTRADRALHAVHVNGRIVASREVHEQLSQVRVGPAGDVVLSVGDGGELVIWGLPNLAPLTKMPLGLGPLRGVTLTPNWMTLVAAEDGSLAVISRQ